MEKGNTITFADTVTPRLRGMQGWLNVAPGKGYKNQKNGLYVDVIVLNVDGSLGTTRVAAKNVIVTRSSFNFIEDEALYQNQKLKAALDDFAKRLVQSGFDQVTDRMIQLIDEAVELSNQTIKKAGSSTPVYTAHAAKVKEALKGRKGRKMAVDGKQPHSVPVDDDECYISE